MAQIDARPGQTILELASGSGETGFLVAEQLGSGGRLISTDLSVGMVEAACRGAASRGLLNVDCRVMDAQQIDLPDSSVDGVVCRHGLMLMPAPERALTEIRRVLRAKGRLAYGVFGPPESNPWMTLLANALRRGRPEAGGDPAGPGGALSLASPERNRALLHEAGFSDVNVDAIPTAMRYGDFEDYWTVQTEAHRPLADLVDAFGPDEVRSVQHGLQAELAPFRSADGYEIPALNLAVSAR